MSSLHEAFSRHAQLRHCLQVGHLKQVGWKHTSMPMLIRIFEVLRDVTKAHMLHKGTLHQTIVQPQQETIRDTAAREAANSDTVSRDMVPMLE